MEQLEQAFDMYMEKVRISHRYSHQGLYDALEPVFERQGYRRQAEKSVCSILIIYLGEVGDIVLMTAGLREIRRNYPAARIVMIAGSMAFPIVEQCPYLNQVISFPRVYSEHMQHQFTFMMGLFKDVCKEYLWKDCYDLCICPQWGDDKVGTFLLAYLSGATRRVGYSDASFFLYDDSLKDSVDLTIESILLTDTVVSPKEVQHEAERNLFMLRKIGMTIENDQMELWYGKREEYRAEQLLKMNMQQGKQIVVLGIGAGGNGRKYPIRQWGEVIQRMSEKFPNLHFVILGGKRESEDAEFLSKQLSQECISSLVGKTSIRESAAIIARAAFYLGNDTGVMHIAAAERIPVIALFREAVDKEADYTGILSEYTRFFPWQSDCIVLRPDHALGDCAHTHIYGGCKELFAHCIAQIPPEEVVQAAEMMLRSIEGKTMME